MTDTEAEKVGREWAAKRGRVPEFRKQLRNETIRYHWFVGYNSDPPCLPREVIDLLPQGPRDYPTEAAAYVALGRAVVRGREVFE